MSGLDLNEPPIHLSKADPTVHVTFVVGYLIPAIFDSRHKVEKLPPMHTAKDGFSHLRGCLSNGSQCAKLS